MLEFSAWLLFFIVGVLHNCRVFLICCIFWPVWGLKRDVATYVVPSDERADGGVLLIVVLFYIYVQFSTAFPFVSLFFLPALLAPRLGGVFFLRNPFFFVCFSVFSGGLELLDLAGYAYDDVFHKVL